MRAIREARVSELELLLTEGNDCLELTNCGIDPIQFRTLCSALKNDMSIKSLYLGGNQMGDGAMIPFADMLGCNSQLASVYLDSNNISSAGSGGVLVEAMHRNTTLTLLFLTCNPIARSKAERSIHLMCLVSG